MENYETSADEVETVTTFLQQNSHFLENYLLKYSTIPFLKDVSSRIEYTTNKSANEEHSNGSIRKETDKACQSRNTDSKNEKEFDSSFVTSPISINIFPDVKEITEKITVDGKSKGVPTNLEECLATKEEKENNFADENNCPSSPSVIPRNARKSVTSDLFHQWLQNGSSKLDPTKLLSSQTSLSVGGTPVPNSPIVGPSSLVGKDLELLEQNDRLMDLILDISNELDINILCHKILLNVGHLTKADRCSLFLARGPREKRYLEAKLFDVDIDTTLDEAMCRANKEEIYIPYGVGICGHVAKTRETINLKDAYEDERFNKEIDAQTGYRTHSLVCMPVCNYDGEVIGVAQIINKRGGGNNHEFTETDLKVFKRYLTFCGIGIQNAQLFEVSILEYKKNQLLLSLAKSLFQEQMSLERLVSTIITEAKELLKCERCTVYLLELKMYDQIDSDLLSSYVVSGGGASIPDKNNGSTTVSSPRESMHGIPISPTSSSIHSSSSRKLLLGGDVDRQDNVSFESQAESTVGSGSGSIFTQSTKHNLDIDVSSFNFHRAWELQEGSKDVHTYAHSDQELQKSRRARIAKYVAASAEVLNVTSVANWLGEKIEDRDGFIPKTMLSVPIFNGQRDVIGVAQLINKKQGAAFVEADIALFEAFAIFCGIGIHNTKMYEGACKLMAKQKVALDCLSYHAAANDDDTNTLAQSEVPKAEEFKLDSYKFNDIPMSSFITYKVVIRMFMEFGLIKQYHIPYKVLCRWVLSVRKNYRPVKYHNWRHALNVCQTMFTVLRTGKMDRFMDELEIFGLLVACLCHDLDHRGTNNAFQSKVVSPLAILYSTSTMEHHHFDQCVMILNSAGNNIFQNLGTDDYKKVMKVVEKAILSTDLALYFRKKNVFMEVANTGEIDWQEDAKKDLLCGMLMTACDVSAIAKPWEVQHELAKKVADEFFDQGDMEKVRLNTQPIAMMDRERKDELPQMQVDFIDAVCRPLYSTLSDSFPWIKPLLDGCLSNREKWADLAEKVEMGLTWIDYETIDKPIEDIVQGTGDADEIEFHVETLANVHETGSNNLGKPGKKDTFGGIKRSFRAQTTTKNNQLKHGGSFFHRRLSSKSPSRYRKSSQSSQLTPTTTGEIIIDGHNPKPHSSLHGTTSTPATLGNDFKGGTIRSKQPCPVIEHPSSTNAIIGGDISSKISPVSQPKMVVTPAALPLFHVDSTPSEGSDKDEVGSALHDRRPELV